MISRIIKVLARERIVSYLLQPSEATLSEDINLNGGGVVNYGQMPTFRFLRLTSAPLYDAVRFTFNYQLSAKTLKLIKNTNINCIICYCSLQLLPAYFIAKITKRPLILVFGDIWFVKSYRARKILGSPPYYILWLILILEKLSDKVADKIVVLSQHDKVILCQYGVKGDKIEVIRQSIDLGEFDAKLEMLSDLDQLRNLYKIPKNKKVAIFHGDLAYLPNKEACEFIVNELEPKIREKRRDIIFVIAGPNPPEELISKNKNVLFTDFVENLPGLIRLADVAVVPIVSGAGVRNKLLDYFACSKPVISTKIGAEGLEVEDMKHLVLVDNLDDFPNKIHLVLDSPALASTLSHNARICVESKHTLKSVEKYVEIINELCQLKSHIIQESLSIS